jgi:metal-responsive CopG/Arc/MetJ family transcriptional regulator
MVRTAISVPDATFARVEAAASRLGVSRSEFYARAAERWLVELDNEERRPRSTVRWRESTTRRRWSTSRS